MKITILGSGTSTGVPMVGCHCPVCTSDDRRDRRSRASILIRIGKAHVLVDTATDLRRQALREKIPRIDAVLFTHSHADHINGIDDLRGFHFLHKEVIPCYGSRETMDVIGANFGYIFTGRSDMGHHPLMEAHIVDGPFDLCGKRVIPLPVEHGVMPATGYRLDDFAYVTDCSFIPPATMELLRGLDTLVIDALRYTPHFTHLNIPSALEVVKELAPRRAVLTHLTHEVPYADTAALPPGVELAYDGMVLVPGGTA